MIMNTPLYGGDPYATRWPPASSREIESREYPPDTPAPFKLAELRKLAPSEHYKIAEELAQIASDAARTGTRPRGWQADSLPTILALAQVHATLATAPN
jgi:hypothetical protein